MNEKTIRIVCNFCERLIEINFFSEYEDRLDKVNELGWLQYENGNGKNCFICRECKLGILAVINSIKDKNEIIKKETKTRKTN